MLEIKFMDGTIKEWEEFEYIALPTRLEIQLDGSFRSYEPFPDLKVCETRGEKIEIYPIKNIDYINVREDNISNLFMIIDHSHEKEQLKKTSTDGYYIFNTISKSLIGPGISPSGNDNHIFYYFDKQSEAYEYIEKELSGLRMSRGTFIVIGNFKPIKMKKEKDAEGIKMNEFQYLIEQQRELLEGLSKEEVLELWKEVNTCKN